MLELITVLVMPGRRILKQRPDALDGYDMVETIAMNMILSKSKLDAVCKLSEGVKKMVSNQTKCEICVKKDVCGKKEVFDYAINSIGNANTSNENMAIHYARDNDAIEVNVRCKFFFGLPNNAR